MPHTRGTWSERLRRGAIIAAVFVLLGVVTTYLVAWRAVIKPVSDVSSVGTPLPFSVVLRENEHWHVRITSQEFDELSGDINNFFANATPQRVRPLPHALVPAEYLRSIMRSFRLAGWPFRCVWGAVDRDIDGLAATTISGEYVSCSPVVWVPFGARNTGILSSSGIDGRLPLGVIWSRFIPNVLIHAALLFTFWRGLVFMSRWTRRRWYTNQNRCPDCGYDRAGLTDQPVCPECGKDLPPVQTLPPGGTS